MNASNNGNVMHSGDDLLKNVFFDYGRKNNLSKELLEEVYNLLIDAQFIPDGEREHIEANLKSLINSNVARKFEVQR